LTRDFSRKAWALTKAGDQPDRIAAKLHCTVEQVSDAVANFEAARHAVSSDIVDMVVNTEVLTAMNGVGNRLQEAMAAKRFTGAYDPATNEPIYDTDHATALDAIDKAGSLIDKVRPKGGGVNVAVGIQNSGNGNGIGQVKTFEQRVREKRGLLPDGDVKLLADGQGSEVVDGEMLDDDDADEIIDDMADGTTEAEIEEADEQRD
jgi:hypothetical protein